MCPFFPYSLSLTHQTAEASDEDEEGRALMVKPGISTVKEEKENDAFFKKVKSCKLIQVLRHLFAFLW